MNIIEKLRQKLSGETYVDIKSLQPSPAMDKAEKKLRYNNGNFAEMTLKQAGDKD